MNAAHKLGLCLFFAFAMAGSAAAQSGDELIVRIGVGAPLTGPASNFGKGVENGARIAIDEANAAGIMIEGKKAKFELLVEDDQADPRTATLVAQKLVDANVSGVIGHVTSGCTIPASKIYSDAGIPEISPSSTAVAYTAQGYKTTFRLIANDAQQGNVLGAYAAKLGKKVAVVDDRTAYGEGVADYFVNAAKAAGVTVVGRQYTTDKAVDFMAILTSIKSRSPDVLFYGGMDSQGGPMAKQIRNLGLKVTLMGADGLDTAEFLKLAGADADGTIASSPGLPVDKMPGGTEFNEKYTAKYGTTQLYAPYAYDSVKVMIAAMEKAGSSEPAKYLPVLASIHYSGVTGPISFDAKGDLNNAAVTVLVVKDGKWEVLQGAGG